MKRTKQSAVIGKAEALAMLQSAAQYCKLAGLTVRAGHVGGALGLTIDGAQLAGDPTAFVLADLPTTTAPEAMAA